MGEIKCVYALNRRLIPGRGRFSSVHKHFIAGAQSGLFKKDVRFHFTPPRHYASFAGSIQYKQDPYFPGKRGALISELSRENNK
ncbi:MAG: hypothetical protein CM1200mP18_09070 [Gammaproteobacteria bacterium]|nr:MAG: hypothetical protein CM1200mP18_09070 [Gammaproteobacteria bacterium]